MGRSNQAEAGSYAGSRDLGEHAVGDINDAGAFGCTDLKRAQGRSTRLEMLPNDAGYHSLHVQAIDVNGIELRIRRLEPESARLAVETF